VTFEVADDRRSGDFALVEILNDVRKELRDEIRLSEGRVRDDLLELRGDFELSSATHAGIHAAEGESRQLAHNRYETFIQRAELDAARRDGALGVIRFAADLAGRNWKAIAAAGGIVAFLLGNIHVDVGLGQ
jgi:hypothetical protein